MQLGDNNDPQDTKERIMVINGKNNNLSNLILVSRYIAMNDLLLFTLLFVEWRNVLLQEHSQIFIFGSDIYWNHEQWVLTQFTSLPLSPSPSPSISVLLSSILSL